MFGSLAKLDWSKFSFEFPAPEVERSFLWALPRKASTQSEGEIECCDTDGEHGTTSDDEHEISGLDLDDENGDDEREDRDEGTSTGGDEAVLFDTDNEKLLLDGEDGEDVLDDDDEDELWSGVGY